MGRKAFTLLELLVVTGIVALLAAILLPSLAHARAQADRLRCANNLRLVGEALNIYRGDLGRYPDVGDRDPSKHIGSLLRPGPIPARWTLTNIGDLAQALIDRFLKRPDPLFCPTSMRWDPRAPKPSG